jgi:hypothetical protein
MMLRQFDVDGFLATAAPPAQAPSISEPGIYAILLTSPDALALVTTGRHGLLYVGMTDATLEARSHFAHRHSGFSTFRRTMGALLKNDLGLLAIPRGSGNSKTNFTNYRFTDAGERALTDWMSSHLLLAQTPVLEGLDTLEKDLIALLEPPLNLTDWPNPQRPMLKSLRAACAEEARGAKG